MSGAVVTLLVWFAAFGSLALIAAVLEMVYLSRTRGGDGPTTGGRGRAAAGHGPAPPGEAPGAAEHPGHQTPPHQEAGRVLDATATPQEEDEQEEREGVQRRLAGGGVLDEVGGRHHPGSPEVEGGGHLPTPGGSMTGQRGFSGAASSASNGGGRRGASGDVSPCPYGDGTAWKGGEEWRP